MTLITFEVTNSILKKHSLKLCFFYGALKEYMGLRKINAIGIKQANKVMHMAAIAYNLKKYLKFIAKTSKSAGKALVSIFLEIKATHNVIIMQY